MSHYGGNNNDDAVSRTTSVSRKQGSTMSRNQSLVSTPQTPGNILVQVLVCLRLQIGLTTCFSSFPLLLGLLSTAVFVASCRFFLHRTPLSPDFPLSSCFWLLSDSLPVVSSVPKTVPQTIAACSLSHSFFLLSYRPILYHQFSFVLYIFCVCSYSLSFSFSLSRICSSRPRLLSTTHPLSHALSTLLF